MTMTHPIIMLTDLYTPTIQPESSRKDSKTMPQVTTKSKLEYGNFCQVLGYSRKHIEKQKKERNSAIPIKYGWNFPVTLEIKPMIRPTMHPATVPSMR
mmetsp:Transcript_15952/g.20961  ORF Transcript_15952/g.20961 Transcript_15952/m.20961 type:complete len:98 (+) Transcript_15952:2534-2827(+)